MAVFFLLITPGPGVLSTAGVGAAYGFNPGIKYVFGLFLGTNLVALIVVSGLATVIFSFPYVRIILLFLSSSYLIYLAIRIGFHGSDIRFLKSHLAPGVLQGFILQLINPKAYFVNLAFYSGFGFYPTSFVIEVLLKLLITNLIWIPIHFLWLYAGVLFYELPINRSSKLVVRIIMSLSLIFVVSLSIHSMLP